MSINQTSYSTLSRMYKWDVDNLNVLLGNKVLTAAGFVLSMGTVWGEVTHFALLDTIPTTATGEPHGRANRWRGHSALCRTEQILEINTIVILKESQNYGSTITEQLHSVSAKEIQSISLTAIM